jgi:pre-mRNA-processing factor SLU7
VEDEFRPGGPGAAAPGGAAQVTGWNMRVREDRAKYLLNLDVDSAFYDPKTRSMRENPYAGTGVDPKDLLYAGDNALKMQ